MRCLCRAAIVRILGILKILTISLHIGYEQGPVVDMQGSAHKVATVLLCIRNAKTWRLPPAHSGESTVMCHRGVCKAPIFRPAYPQGVGKSGHWAISTHWVARSIITGIPLKQVACS